MCTSTDGFVTTPQGWPAQLADPDFSAESYGFVQFQQTISAVLMGRRTFEPALDADRWPWGDLDVFVLASQRPERTPDHVVVDRDPARLLEQLRSRHPAGDVHLVGGPTTIEAFRRVGALDHLGLLVLPLLLGDGMRLTPALGTDTGLVLKHQAALPNGVVELGYDVQPAASR